jgi:hypothetical protein
MNDRPDQRPRTAKPEPPASTRFDRARRRLPATLLDAAAVLSTTVMIVAIDPKIPPFRGD